jgi:hypothetical protein
MNDQPRELLCVGCGVVQRHSFHHALEDRTGRIVWFRCDVCSMPRSLDVAPADRDLDRDEHADLYLDLGDAG